MVSAEWNETNSNSDKFRQKKKNKYYNFKGDRVAKWLARNGMRRIQIQTNSDKKKRTNITTLREIGWPSG